MFRLLKQAEDILNMVDQQANAAINQTTKTNSKDSSLSAGDDPSALDSTANLSSLSTNRSNSSSRRSKKNDDADLLDYLNSSTPVTKKTNRSTVSNNTFSDSTRTASSPNMLADENTMKTHETSAAKSASATPRSMTPAASASEDDEGLVLVRGSSPKTFASMIFIAPL